MTNIRINCIIIFVKHFKFDTNKHGHYIISVIYYIIELNKNNYH